jgi:hypothetical protein
MFSKKPQHNHSDEWISTLIECSTEAVQAYEQYLLDKINHNKLAKVMKKLHNILPPTDYPKAKKIEDRDYKEFFD